jgi:hypothetical protein
MRADIPLEALPTPRMIISISHGRTNRDVLLTSHAEFSEEINRVLGLSVYLLIAIEKGGCKCKRKRFVVIDAVSLSRFDAGSATQIAGVYTT